MTFGYGVVVNSCTVVDSHHITTNVTATSSVTDAKGTLVMPYNTGYSPTSRTVLVSVGDTNGIDAAQFTGNVTMGSNQITSISATANLVNGQTVYDGAGSLCIPLGTTYTISGTTATMSANATCSATGDKINAWVAAIPVHPEVDFMFQAVNVSSPQMGTITSITPSVVSTHDTSSTVTLVGDTNTCWLTCAVGLSQFVMIGVNGGNVNCTIATVPDDHHATCTTNPSTLNNLGFKTVTLIYTSTARRITG